MDALVAEIQVKCPTAQVYFEFPDKWHLCSQSPYENSEDGGDRSCIVESCIVEGFDAGDLDVPDIKPHLRS